MALSERHRLFAAVVLICAAACANQSRGALLCQHPGERCELKGECETVTVNRCVQLSATASTWTTCTARTYVSVLHPTSPDCRDPPNRIVTSLNLSAASDGSSCAPSSSTPVFSYSWSCLSSPACFPADALVEVRTSQANKSRMIHMRDVALGDHVRDATGEFSEVFMWGHRDDEIKSSRFVELTLACGLRLVASEEQLIFTQEESALRRVRADQVDEGNFLSVAQNKACGNSSVARVKRSVTRSGLFHPHTRSGTLVVNDIKVSTYTDFAGLGWGDREPSIRQHVVWHALESFQHASLFAFRAMTCARLDLNRGGALTRVLEQGVSPPPGVRSVLKVLLHNAE